MSPPQPIFHLLVCHSHLVCHSIPVNILIVLNHNMSYSPNSNYLNISPPIMLLHSERPRGVCGKCLFANSCEYTDTTAWLDLF